MSPDNRKRCLRVNAGDDTSQMRGPHEVGDITLYTSRASEVGLTERDGHLLGFRLF